MHITNRSIVLTCVICSGLLLLPPLLAGCEDAEARKRMDVQEHLEKAAVQYRQATIARVSLGDEDAELVRNELNAVVADLARITEGEPAQRAAAALLSADALLELASMNLQQAKLVEFDLLRIRDVVHGHLAGMELLHARSSGRLQASTDSVQQDARQLRQATERELREVQRSIEELASPIAELQRLNEEDRAQVRELRERTNDLLRHAAELGHSDGFEHVKEAAATRRQADRIEYRAAMRDIELDQEMRPQDRLFRHRLEAARTLIDALEGSLNDLQAFEEMRAGDVQRLDQHVSERRTMIRETVQRITDQQSSVLDPLYDEAAEHLQQAVNQATRAAGLLRGAEATPARLATMRSYEMLGELNWSRARGATSHAALLGAMVSAGDLVGRTDSYTAELEAVRTHAEQLIENTREAYQQAGSSADQITGRAADAVRPARERLEQLSSKLADWRVDAPVRQRDFGSISDVEVNPDAGFESADELLAFLEQIDGNDMASMKRLLDATFAQTSAGKAELRIMRMVLEALTELDDAMQDEFGVGAAAAFEGMPGMDMNPFGTDGFTVTDRTETRVTIEASGQFGMTETIELMEINGRWFVSGDPADDVDDDMGAAMMEQMMGAIAQSIRSMAGRVRAGEFESAEQVGSALMQQMMQGMGGPGGQGF